MKKGYGLFVLLLVLLFTACSSGRGDKPDMAEASVHGTMKEAAGSSSLRSEEPAVEERVFSAYDDFFWETFNILFEEYYNFMLTAKTLEEDVPSEDPQGWFDAYEEATAGFVAAAKSVLDYDRENLNEEERMMHLYLLDVATKGVESFNAFYQYGLAYDWAQHEVFLDYADEMIALFGILLG